MGLGTMPRGLTQAFLRDNPQLGSINTSVDEEVLYGGPTLWEPTLAELASIPGAPPQKHPRVQNLLDTVDRDFLMKRTNSVHALSGAMRRDLYRLLRIVASKAVRPIPTDDPSDPALSVVTKGNSYEGEELSAWYRRILRDAESDQVLEQVQKIVAEVGMSDVMLVVLSETNDTFYHNLTRPSYGLEGPADERAVQTIQDAARDIFQDPELMQPCVAAFADFQAEMTEIDAAWGEIQIDEFHAYCLKNPRAFAAFTDFQHRLSEALVAVVQKISSRVYFYSPRHSEGTDASNSDIPLNAHDLNDIRSFLHWDGAVTDELRRASMHGVLQAEGALRSPIMGREFHRLLESFHEALYHRFRRSRFPALNHTYEDVREQGTPYNAKEHVKYSKARQAKANQEQRVLFETYRRLTTDVHGQHPLQHMVLNNSSSIRKASALTLNNNIANNWMSHWVAEVSPPADHSLRDLILAGAISLASDNDAVEAEFVPSPSYEATLIFFGSR